MKVTKNKGFTLVETLLTTMLMLMLVSASIICMSSVSNTKNIENKVFDYITLNRYAKCYAEINGKPTKIFVENNKIQVQIENKDGEFENIQLLTPQIQELNDNVYFEIPIEVDIEDPIVDNVIAVYLPDGSLEKGGVVNIGIEDETNDVVSVIVNNWNQFSVINTNEVILNETEDGL